MIKNLFPLQIINLIYSKFNINGIYEIRIRTQKPIYVNYFGDYVPLRDKNFQTIYADKKLIDYVITQATEMSVYRYNSQIKQGFITTQNGIRIGLAGEIVETEDNFIRTIKNPSSLVIRIPHEIKNCAHEIMPYIVDERGIKNTLIISPPGCGKTTIIRDIARTLSLNEKVYNILIVDERYEIAGAEGGNLRLDVGETTDVVSGGTKEFSFLSGIRTLKPDVIITDEIGSKKDAVAIKLASLSGVKIIATAHAQNEQEILKRNNFIDLINNRIFETIIVLSSKKGMGTIEAVLNSNFNPIC